MANIGKLKEGSLFGALSGKNDWLYCEVERFEGSVIVAHVINGAWTARFNANGTMDVMDGDHVVRASQKGMVIAFTGELPREVRGDYNEAIDYMSRQLAKNPVSRSVSDRLLALRFWFARVGRATRAAKNAFVRSWNPSRPMSDEEADDLMIPF